MAQPLTQEEQGGIIKTGARGSSLVAALLICLFAGFGYSWSVVQTPIANGFGWDAAGVSLTFTLTVCFSTLSPLLLGKWIQKWPVRRTVLIGSVLYGCGLFAVGFISQLWQLYLFYGIFSGVGCGLIYPTMMSYVVRLYPERAGLVSGLGTAFYGAGAIVWAPVMVRLIDALGLGMAFHVLGLCFLAVIAAASLLLKEPPRPVPQSKTAQTEQTQDLRRSEMVKTPAFYLTVVAFSLGLTAGLMIISQASPILQGSLDFTPALAASFVSIFAACNTLGRFGWGTISDKIGASAAMSCLFLLDIAAMLLLTVVQLPWLMLLCMGIAASCYGGFAGILTPLTAKLFGATYITENYGVMYVVFGISSLLAPNIAIRFLAATGSYLGAYLTAAVFAVLGLLLSRLLAKKIKLRA